MLLLHSVLQVFSYSNFNRAEGEVGECTAAALNGKDVQWAKVRAVKEKAPSKQYGVPAEPGPDLGIEYRYSIPSANIYQPANVDWDLNSLC